eukprot:GEZU01016496.1.p1 GENE.GEZU01016496.1~~GEZU01016496.1.p1  ORF type:complete len:1059 (-),score=425.58 GEZU01016496.1:268-3444(-)
MEGGFGITCASLLEINEAKDLERINVLGGVGGLCEALKSDPRHGLTTEEAENPARIAAFGKNIYPKPKGKNLIVLWFEALRDPMLIILMVLSVVSIILGVAFPEGGKAENRKWGWIEGAAIFLAVLIVSSVTAINDYSKDKQFRKLSEDSKKINVNVVRDGRIQEVLIDNLVVGDIVELTQGDQVPADGVLVEGFNLKTDESVMTGETDMVKKTEKAPFMLSGCQVADGNGKMLVTAVGVNSEWGQTVAKLVGDNPDTPLQTKLERLAGDIGKMGVFFAVITFVVLILGWVIRDFGVNKKKWEWSDMSQIVNFAVIAVTIVVVAVPEGLPLAVTMSLAFSVKKMMKDNNLVRHLAACETMGGATNICSDKTGTLTLNQMRVVKAYLGGKTFEDPPQREDINQTLINLLCEAIAVNSTATINKVEGNPLKEYETIGNKTECAILILGAKDLGVDCLAIRKEFKDNERFRQMFTFHSDRKRMSTIVRLADGTFRLHCKGAAEIVSGLCKTMIDSNGDVVPISEATRAQIDQTIYNFADTGLRTICLAYRNFPEDDPQWDEGENPPEQDLTFIGIVGIKDPLRPEVRGAVAQCKKSGIMVRMVTGDNILTARYIARDCGILSENGIAMEGKDFRKMTDPEIDAILPRLEVLARSTPSDKYKLVKRLRDLGEVVAVTGDGTNDAPALKEADVGLSMGLSGTEVAKEASDIVILDDNFNSIVKSVLWGRSVMENIKKFLQFQLTVNIVALLLIVITSFTSFLILDKSGEHLDPPLAAIQLLWVNLIMDTFAALALATEPPTPDLLDRKPYGRYEHLISSIMIRNMVAQAIFQLLVLLLLYYLGVRLKFVDENKSNHTTQLNTAVFNMFVFCQLFNEINSRKVNKEWNVFSGIHKSYPFLGIWALTAVVQALIVEFGGRFTHTTGLTWYQWLITIGIASLSLPLGLIVRCIPVPDRPPGKPPKPKKKKKSKKDAEEEKANGNSSNDETNTKLEEIKTDNGNEEEILKEEGRKASAARLQALVGSPVVGEDGIELQQQHQQQATNASDFSLVDLTDTTTNTATQQ